MHFTHHVLTGSSSWTYNALQEETGYTNGAGATVGYGYDAAGSETSITYPGGEEKHMIDPYLDPYLRHQG